MAVRVAINGFGRIGRLAFRQMFGAEGYEVVAINDLTSPKNVSTLVKNMIHLRVNMSMLMKFPAQMILSSFAVKRSKSTLSQMQTTAHGEI